MRELVAKYLNHSLSRRGFVRGLTKAGLTATAAQSVLGSVSSVSLAQTAVPSAAPSAAATAASTSVSTAAAAGGAVKSFQGTGGAAFAEHVTRCRASCNSVRACRGIRPASWCVARSRSSDSMGC